MNIRYHDQCVICSCTLRDTDSVATYVRHRHGYVEVAPVHDTCLAKYSDRHPSLKSYKYTSDLLAALN